MHLFDVINAALSIGAFPTESPESIRQRHMMLVIHYVMMTIGPLPNVLLYLFCGLKWPAFVLFMTCSVPSWISFGLYVWLIRSLNLSIWIITSMPLYAPVLITLFAGGIQNSGYITHYVFVSPLIWLCIKRKVRSSLVLFGLAIASLVVHSVLEAKIHSFFVEKWGTAPILPTETRRWYWLINIIELQTLNFLFFGVAFVEIQKFLKQNELLQAQMTTISLKLLTLDIDELPSPPTNAPALEKALFDVVLKVREWKPYIPATLLFMSDESSRDFSMGLEMDDDEEDHHDEDEEEEDDEAFQSAHRKMGEKGGTGGGRNWITGELLFPVPTISTDSKSRGTVSTAVTMVATMIIGPPNASVTTPTTTAVPPANPNLGLIASTVSQTSAAISGGSPPRFRSDIAHQCWATNPNPKLNAIPGIGSTVTPMAVPSFLSEGVNSTPSLTPSFVGRGPGGRTASVSDHEDNKHKGIPFSESRELVREGFVSTVGPSGTLSTDSLPSSPPNQRLSAELLLGGSGSPSGHGSLNPLVSNRKGGAEKGGTP